MFLFLQLISHLFGIISERPASQPETASNGERQEEETSSTAPRGKQCSLL